MIKYRLLRLRHKKRREALHCRSLHDLRLVGMALQVETSNAEPHADMYNNTLICPKVAIGAKGNTNG